MSVKNTQGTPPLFIPPSTTFGYISDQLARYVYPRLIQGMLKWPDQETLKGERRFRPPKAGKFRAWFNVIKAWVTLGAGAGAAGGISNILLQNSLCAANRPRLYLEKCYLELNLAKFRPLSQSLDWINRLFDPNWHPPASVKDEMIFIRKEYGPLSASHVRWQKNGYKIQVTQSRAIIAIRLEPIKAHRAATTQAEMEAYARGLCMKLFGDTFQTTFRYRPMDDPVRIKDIRAKIAEYAFEYGLKRCVDGGLAGTAWKRKFFPPGARAPSRRGTLIWWQYLGWYTDGKTVAFWTFKVSGDSWHVPPACVVDPIGNKWF